MRKICIAFSIFIFSISCFYAQEMELVKTFTNGSDENSLLFGDEYADSNNRLSPNGMTFDESGNLHINDTWNERIVIYDTDLNVSSIIPVPGGHITLLADYFSLLPEGYLSVYSKDRYSLVDRNGKSIFYYSFQLHPLRESLSSYYDQVIYHEYFFKKTRDGRIFCILLPEEGNADRIGRILWDDDVFAMFEKNSEYDMGDLTLDSDGFFFLNGELYTQDYFAFASFWMRSRGITTTMGFSNESGHAYDPVNKESTSMTYIGKDENGYYYWCLSNRMIQIFSDKGYVVEFFQYDRHKSNIFPVVSPSGDLYFLASSKEGHSLYRIKRNW